jgi:hypothetical protein
MASLTPSKTSLFCILWAAVCAASQLCAASNSSKPVIHPVKVEASDTPLLDGVLDDPAWALATPVSDFRQREPNEGDPATEKTEVRIVYTQSALYLGVICFDSEPDRIQATQLRRDDTLQNDDTFAFLFDTYNDSRNAYLFRTNALGARYDALITDESRNVNSQWDEKWSAEGKINGDGWALEIEIPFKSLRSRKDELQSWGINFERMIRRKNEETYWSGYGQDYEFWNVSQAGQLNQLESVKTGLRLRIKPYVLGGFTQLPPQEDGSNWENESRIGLEDVKVSITPSVTADFTVNPDFAQADVDESRVNLTRFSLFFPEKREFFLEGAGMFEFGTAPARFSFGGPEVVLFYSRRIGIDEDEEGDREQVPINFGAKLTGDAGGFQFGLLNAGTRNTDFANAANFSVFRVKRKILQRSYVGGMFTNKSVSNDGGFNRVFGVDANFVLFDKMVLTGFFAKSDSGLDSKANQSYQASARWNSDLFDVDAERTSVDRDFDPQIGFVLRDNMTKHRFRLAWKPRPGIDFIRQFWVSTTHQFYQSHDGFLESRENEAFFGLRLESGDFLGAGPVFNYESLDEPFEIHPDVTIPEGDYEFYQTTAWARFFSGRRIAGGARMAVGQFYDGTLLSLSFDPSITINEHLSVDLSYGHSKADLPWGSFTAQVINSRFNVNLSNKLMTSTTVQYDNVSDEFNFNFRVNYIYRPGDDLFIVYNEGRDLDMMTRGLLNRTLLVKFTHSFDF